MTDIDTKRAAARDARDAARATMLADRAAALAAQAKEQDNG